MTTVDLATTSELGGTLGGSGDMRWATAVDLWADWMRSEGIRPRTIELRRYQISHLGDDILRRSPWRVKSSDLIAWMAQQEWASETRRSYRSAINGFYAWAIRAGHTKRNPVADIKAPKMIRGRPKPAPDRILDAAFAIATDADRMMITLAAYAGLRRAEIAVFRMDLIEDNKIRVTGKGDHVRSVPVHSLLAAELDAELDRRAEGKRGSGYRYSSGIGEGWMFPGRHGGHLTPNAVGKRLTKLLGPGWTGHTLRHRFLTRVLDKSGNLAVAQELAGHASPATTRIYAGPTDVALRDAVNAI